MLPNAIFTISSLTCPRPSFILSLFFISTPNIPYPLAPSASEILLSRSSPFHSIPFNLTLTDHKLSFLLITIPLTPTTYPFLSLHRPISLSPLSTSFTPQHRTIPLHSKTFLPISVQNLSYIITIYKTFAPRNLTLVVSLLAYLFSLVLVSPIEKTFQAYHLVIHHISLHSLPSSLKQPTPPLLSFSPLFFLHSSPAPQPPSSSAPPPPATRNPQLSTLDPQPSTRNPQPSPLHPHNATNHNVNPAQTQPKPPFPPFKSSLPISSMCGEYLQVVYCGWLWTIVC